MAKVSKDHVDKWYDYDIDLDNRTIYIGSVGSDEEGESGVDFLMAERAIKAIHLLDSSAPKGDKPITIIMNNIGGCWFHGMAIYDVIKGALNHITIKVYGHAMSMGSIILLAADDTKMAPNSKYMIHYGTDGAYNHSKIFQQWAKEGQRINEDMENIYMEVLLEKDQKMITAGDPTYFDNLFTTFLNKQNEGNIPKEEPVKIKLPKDPIKREKEIRKLLKQMLNFDTIFNAEETVAFGFAKGIL